MRWLARGWPVLVVVAGGLVFAPAIGASLLHDDYAQAAMTSGTYPAPRGPLALYDFVGDASRDALWEHGPLPWFAHPRLTVRFLRPLASALLFAEHRAFHGAALPLHLVSFAWWAAAVLAACRFYRRWLSPRAAVIATVAFALSPCHVWPLAWAANVEAPMALTFGALALDAYVRWRDDGAARDGALALAGFALAFATGEYALAFTGYVLALERGRVGAPRGRAVALLPFLLPAAAYLATHVALGYGTTGSGWYADPLHDPAALAALAPWRLTALLANLWLTVSAEGTTSVAGRVAVALVVLGAAALALIPMRRALASLEPGPRRTATAMLVGSTLAVIPSLPASPSARLVGAAMLGFAPVLAVLLEHAWFPSDATRGRAGNLTTTCAALLAFAHLVHAPVVAHLASRTVHDVSTRFSGTLAHLRADLAAHPARAPLTVVAIRAEDGSLGAPFAADPTGRRIARWRILSMTDHVLVLRHDAQTLELVTPPETSLFARATGNLYRGTELPFHVGEIIEQPGLRVTIVAVSPTGPTDVLAHFDDDLDAPSFVFVTQDHTGFHRVTPPRIGEGAPFDP